MAKKKKEEEPEVLGIRETGVASTNSEEPIYTDLRPAVEVHALSDAEVIEKTKSLGFVVIPEVAFAQLFNTLVTGNILDLRGPAAVRKLGEMLGAKDANESQVLWEKFKLIDQKRVNT
jgi:hypothetical protein